MSGTVTTQVICTGVNAETFEDAVEKVKALPGLKKIEVTTFEDYISYTIPGEMLVLYGRMENIKLEVI